MQNIHLHLPLLHLHLLHVLYLLNCLRNKTISEPTKNALTNSFYQNWPKIVTLLIGVHCMHRLVLLRFIPCFGKNYSWCTIILPVEERRFSDVTFCASCGLGANFCFQKLCPDCRDFHVRQFLNPKTLRTLKPAQCLVLASTAAKRLRRFEAVVRTASKARARFLIVHYNNSDISDLPIFLVLQQQF